MCAQSPANFDLPSITEIMGSLIFQQLEMVVMMMMAWNLPSSLCWSLSRFRRKNFDQKPVFDVNQPGRRGLRIFQFWFDDGFNAWCRVEILSEFRKIFIFTAQRKFWFELHISCRRLIGDFPILYMIVKGQVMQIKVRLIRRNLMSRVLQAEILAKY